MEFNLYAPFRGMAQHIVLNALEETSMKNSLLTISIVTALCGCSTFEFSQQELSCPAKDFHSFTSAFRSNESIQRQWTYSTLELTSSDSSDWDEKKNDFRIRKWVLQGKQISFPIIMDWKEQLKLQKDFGIPRYDLKVDAEKLLLKYYVSDSGFSLNYIFEETPSGCWKLIRIENYNF